MGSAPYSSAHVERIEELAASDPRVRLLGGVWDQEQLDQLYAHAVTYVHGHSVGGTNPSLLRAMGAGAFTLAYDVTFNREVLGGSGRFFRTPDDLARLLADVETYREAVQILGDAARERAASSYAWEDVADRYEELCVELLAGYSQRGDHSGRRSGIGRTIAENAAVRRFARLRGEVAQRGAQQRAGRVDRVWEVGDLDTDAAEVPLELVALRGATPVVALEDDVEGVFAPRR